MKRNLKRIFLSVAGACLALMMLLSAASCGSSAKKETDAPNATDKETMPPFIEVPVFAEDVAFGAKITTSKVTTKTIPSSALSSTMVTSVDEVVGSYATVALYKGDFAYKGKLSPKRPTISISEDVIEKTKNKYLDVSQFIEPNSGKDVSAALQKLIDDNTHRTIYFPDGEYLISKPLQTSAAAINTTSFYLSDNAVIKASNDWTGAGDALIKLGASEPKNDITTNGSNYHFIGGILDGNGKAKGIALVSGRESLVSKVKIINATVGIYIPEGANSNSSDMDIEDIDIIGCGADSKGIVAIGYDNNFTDIRISNVKTGIEASTGNFFRGVSVRLDKVEKNQAAYQGSVAFVTSGWNWFYSCTSENMQTAYYVRSGTRPIIKDFSIRWTEAQGEQIAFTSTAGFSACCSNGFIDFFDESTDNYVIKSSGAYSGTLLDVSLNESLCDDDSYKSIFHSSSVTSGEEN